MRRHRSPLLLVTVLVIDAACEVHGQLLLVCNEVLSTEADRLEMHGSSFGWRHGIEWLDDLPILQRQLGLLHNSRSSASHSSAFPLPSEGAS